jgi:tRNA-splicing ligase RtcB
MSETKLRKVTEWLWEMPPTGAMRVPARIYASETMLAAILRDNAAAQAANVACLPGIVRASFAMPDIHWGYGFPIGGVAAFDVEDGVVSPGGVGYDINCGVRLMAADLAEEDVSSRIRDIMNRLFRDIPTGVGSSGAYVASPAELRDIALHGASWAVDKGFGAEADLACIEERGRMADADPQAVSDRAWQRGKDQVGTLGAGNHFLEIGHVTDVYDPAAAAAFGLSKGQVTLAIHCGSRGFGHQVCDDSLAAMDRAARRYGISLPDRQLACAPVKSPEGQAYLRAMRCAVNYAFANRQMIAHNARHSLARAVGRTVENLRLRTVYEVAHNIAKIETHPVDGTPRTLCVHRKGATRSFAPDRPEVPSGYRGVGQPVLIPGDMGRCSYVLAGTVGAMEQTFGSTCHGAGRALSRHAAAGRAKGRNIARELADRGIVVIGQSRHTLDEEMPEAYKDVSEVVEVCERAGLSRRVAQIRPLGCIKG